MIEKSNIIIIGSVDWITNWQTQHRLAYNLSKKNKVLFIENTGVRNLKFNDFSRVKDRFNNWKKSQMGFKKINKNLTILSPLIIPFPHSSFVSKINSHILNYYISNLKFFFNLKPNFVITFLPTKLSDEIMKIINCNINIYYCANEMTGVNNQNKKIIAIEKYFFSNCDHTFVISKNLEKKAKKNSKNVSILPTGVELDKFNYAKIQKKKIFKSKKFNIGYIGSVTDVFDIDLIEYLAFKNPQFNFIIVGRIYCNVSKLKKIKNIFFFNEVPHYKVPYIIKGFDVGLIPYKVNNFTHSVYSCKLNEYLAMGLPVVSTNLDEINNYNKKYQKILSVAKNYNEFSNLINSCVTTNNKNKIVKRIAAAAKNSWKSRFENFELTLSKIQVQKFLDRNNANKNFVDYYNIKYNLKKIFLTFLTLIIFLFSPISLIIGDLLVKKEKIDDIHNIKNIVVFSGNGEGFYNNLSYQKRYQDIVKLLNNNNIKPNIFLSGKKFIFEESEIIRNFLIANNVDTKKITIIKGEEFYNTFNQIKFVGNLLKKLNLSDQEVVFLTSPYHSLRSKLIWKKNFPEINIKIPNTIEYEKKNIFNFGFHFKEIKIILYEILSILFNIFKGWI